MLNRALTRRTSWIALALIWLQLLLPVLGHAWPRDVTTGMDMAEFCTMPGMGASSVEVITSGDVAAAGGSQSGTAGNSSCAWCCGCSATTAALPTPPSAGLLLEPLSGPPALSDRPAPRPAVPLQRAAARAPPARS
ncbi:MAG: DUF2946 family protein [Burkholderiales bacterium]|nr:DUF2946 family protein [Burkholderiales bacterium]